MAVCSGGVNNFVNKPCGKDTKMSKKILVAFGSHAGSTAEAADVIAGALADKGAAVEVKPVEKVKDIKGYDAVVIGTNIRAGNIKGPVKSFASRFAAKLADVPVALFVVCLTMKDDTPENRKTVSAWLEQIQLKNKPVDAGLFAGKVEFAKLGFFARYIMEKMAKAAEQDFMDRDKIKSWANALYPKLFQKDKV